MIPKLKSQRVTQPFSFFVCSKLQQLLCQFDSPLCKCGILLAITPGRHMSSLAKSIVAFVSEVLTSLQAAAGRCLARRTACRWPCTNSTSCTATQSRIHVIDTCNSWIISDSCNVWQMYARIFIRF